MSTDQPIRLVAFDWGGVILKHHRSWADSCASAGIEARAWHDRQELILQRRALNLEFQSGRISPEEFYPKLAAATGGLYTAAEVRRIHDAWLTEEYPGVDALVRRLCAVAGVETALLSNTNECHWARMRDFPTAGLLKHRHASHLLGHAKPGLGIFRAFEKAVGYRGAEIHLGTDVGNVPAGEFGELLCIPFVSLRQLTPILFRGGAFIIAGPGVAQHITTLEVGTIGGFLQHEVFRKMCGVVTNLHPRDENVSRSRANRHLSRHRSRLTYPKNAEGSQLFK